MARTVGEVLTSAAKTLNDASNVRHTQAEQIGFVVDALNMAKNMRPDLFLGRLHLSFGTLTTQSELPLDEQFFRPIVDYVIFRCETKNAEDVESGRAALTAQLSGGFLQ